MSKDTKQIRLKKGLLFKPDNRVYSVSSFVSDCVFARDLMNNTYRVFSLEEIKQILEQQ